MNALDKFQTWAEDKNLPIKYFVGPLDRWAIKLGLFSKPRVYWKLWQNVIWSWVYFVVGFPLAGYLLFEALFGIPVLPLFREHGLALIALGAGFSVLHAYSLKKSASKFQLPPWESFS